MTDPLPLKPVSAEQLDIIARVCHEAIRAFSIAHKQVAPPGWDEVPDWMRAATYAGIRFRLEHPDAPANAQHEQWVAEKKAAGWVHGPVKDPVKKTHPSIVPYAALPAIERDKDALFAAVVRALAPDA